MPIDEPMDNETDVAVEAESLELELEVDNDDESVELEADDDEDDMSRRESHSILIGGTSVLKSSIAKKGRGKNSVFVHFCDDSLVPAQQPRTVHAVLRGNLRTKKICTRTFVCKPNVKGTHTNIISRTKYKRNVTGICTRTHRKGPKMTHVHESAYKSTYVR